MLIDEYTLQLTHKKTVVFIFFYEFIDAFLIIYYLSIAIINKLVLRLNSTHTFMHDKNVLSSAFKN